MAELADLQERVRALEQRLQALTDPFANPGQPPGKATPSQDFALVNAVEEQTELQDVRVEGAALPQVARVDSDDNNKQRPLGATSGRRRLSELFIAVEEWSPSEDIWAASLFIGTPVVSPLTSVLLALAVMCCCTLEGLFLWQIQVNFISDPLDVSTLEGLLRFRIGPGHDVQFADSITRSPLISRVCNGDSGLLYASTQYGTYSTLTNYLTIGQSSGGPVVTVMAMILWAAVNMGKILELWTTLRAYCSLPEGDGGGITLVEDDEGLKVKYTSMSRTRLFLTILLNFIPRLTIVVTLLVFGMWFLCLTNSIQSLVSNCILLAFVLDIPTTLYPVLVQSHLSAVIARTSPITITTRPTFQRLNLWGFGVLIKCMVLVAMVALFYEIYAKDFLLRVAMAQDILCSGNLNFVYSVNPVTGIPVAGQFQAWSAYYTSSELGVLSLAQLSMGNYMSIFSQFNGVNSSVIAALSFSNPIAEIMQSPSGTWRDAGLASADDFAQLVDLRAASALVAASYRSCSDYITGPLTAALTGSPGNLSCSSYSSQCNLPNASVVRMLCPITCNCQTSSLWPGVLATPTFGCPSSCVTWQKYSYTNQFSHAINGHYYPPCSDMVGLSPVTQPGMPLAVYLRSVFDYIAVNPKFNTTFRFAVSKLGWSPSRASDLLASLLNGTSLNELLSGRWNYAVGTPHPRNLTGCAFLTSPETTTFWQMDLCQTGSFRSVRSVCPYSCGCIGGMDECPYMCSYGFLGLGYSNTDPLFYNA